jgi:hypothetical protein
MQVGGDAPQVRHATQRGAQPGVRQTFIAGLMPPYNGRTVWCDVCHACIGCTQGDAVQPEVVVKEECKDVKPVKEEHDGMRSVVRAVARLHVAKLQHALAAAAHCCPEATLSAE